MTMYKLLFLLFLIFSVTTKCSNGFNLNVKQAIIPQNRDTLDSMFGFSVAIAKGVNNKATIIVGAPNSQQTDPRNVKNGGAVYQCDLSRRDCRTITLDASGNTLALDGQRQIMMDEKSNQWLGATVVASKTSDAVMACAPRYEYRHHGKEFVPYGPVGKCILVRNVSRGGYNSIKELTPTKRWDQSGYHRWGFAMLGFSAAMSENDEKLFMGGPAAYYWQGAMFFQDSQNTKQFSHTENRSSIRDNNYLGYSTASGFLNNDRLEDVVTGIPRGNNFTGMVEIYEDNAKLIGVILGEQFGSYFGASVAVSDIDMDGLDDVIIGAPFYTSDQTEDPTEAFDYEDGGEDLDVVEKDEEEELRKKAGVGQEATKNKYDIGKVYVYFQSQSGGFRRHVAVTGQQEHGGFGHSVLAAGDLNQDGYNDIIVGAPYDGPSGRGAIYVYHGTKRGMKTKPSQVIMAEDIPSPRDRRGGGIRTFGYSLSGDKDIDENGYPDVVVGAYESGHVIAIRTKPVVSVEGYTTAKPTMVSLEERARTCKDNGTVHFCGTFKVCLKYDGKGVPETLDMDLTIEIDAKKADEKRAWFTIPGKSKLSHSFNYEKGAKASKRCEKYTYSVKNSITDKLSPIVIRANYSIKSLSSQRGLALDPKQGLFIEHKLEIQKNCGSDEICIPDLSMKASLDKEKYVKGKDKKVFLDVEIENKEEDAYESAFFLSVPPSLQYVTSVQKSKKSSAVSCTTPKIHHKDKRNVIKCDIGNPLAAEKKVHFQLEFSTTKANSKLDVLQFDMHVNSTNEERESTMGDNKVELSAPLEVEANLFLNGVSQPEMVTYDSTEYKRNIKFDVDVGPSVSHVYEIRNRGPSDFASAVVNIYWPSFLQRKEENQTTNHLLHLMDDPEVDGDGVECLWLQQGNINPGNLQRSWRAADEPSSNPRLKRQSSYENDADDYNDGVPAASNTAHAIIRNFRNLVRKVKEMKDQKLDFSQKLRRLKVDCNDMRCTQLRCDINKGLKEGQRVLIKIRSHLWVNTLIKEAFYDAEISSVAIAKVLQLDLDAKDVELPIKAVTVTTKVNPRDPTQTRRSLPFWLILIAILAGITLLILLILLLWKLGFFKRNRPPRGQAEVTKPPDSDYYGYQGYSSGYAPSSQYDPQKHGDRL